MPRRAQLLFVAVDEDGDVQRNKAVTITNTSGGALGQTIYDAATGGGVVTSPTTNAHGVLELYADLGQACLVSVAGGVAQPAWFDPDAGEKVTKTDAQTLTNKTLTAPAIAAPVLSGSGTLSNGGSLSSGSDTFTIKATLQDAGGFHFNVKHPKFGAVGDAVSTGVGTDDTAAIQAACDAAAAAGGGTVYVPPGGYKLTATINVRSGVMLVGAGWSDIDDTGAEAGAEAVVFYWAGANLGTMFAVAPSVAGKVVIGGGFDGLVLDGYVSGSSTVNAGTAIHLVGTQQHRIGRIRIRNVETYGIWYDDYLSGTDGAISASNYLEALDFQMGSWNGVRMIGANAIGVYYHGSSYSTANATSYAGVTKNVFTRIRGQVYNGDVVRYRYADNNHGIMVHTILVGAGAWGAAGTGYGVRFETSDATSGGATHSTHGFPAGNVIENCHGGVYVGDYTHGNRVVRHSSEGARIFINDVSKGHISYTAFDYITLKDYATVQFPMTDEQSFGVGDMGIAQGTPTFGGIANIWPVATLADAASSAVGGVRTPYLWTNGTITRIRIRYSNDVANNNFAIRLRASTLGYGVVGGAPTPPSFTAEYDSGTTTLAADSSTARGCISDLFPNLAYTQGDTLDWSLQRIGGDAADTNTGNLHIREVSFFFASSGPINTGGIGSYTAAPPTETPF